MIISDPKVHLLIPNRPRKNPETGETHGKGAHFPLVDESERWRRPTDPCRERPKLLDPTDPEDPPLLSFNIDGRIAVALAYEDDSVAVSRVEASRIYLHLDWPRFVGDRRNLYAKIYLKVLEGDQAYVDMGRDVTGAKEKVKHVARELIRLVGDKKPYSKAAQTYVLLFRDRGWVQRFVLPHVPGSGA